VGGLGLVMRTHAAVEIEEPQIVDRVALPALRRLVEIVGRGLLVAGDAAALEIHHAEGVLRLAVAGLGGELVPLQRLGEIAWYAIAALIDEPDEGLCGGVAFLGAIDRELESGQVEAALEGAI